MRMRNCRSFLFTWQGAVKRYRWVGVNLNVDDSVKYRTSTFKQEHRTCHFNKQFLFYFAVHDWQNSCPCRTENIWKLSVLLQRSSTTWWRDWCQKSHVVTFLLKIRGERHIHSKKYSSTEKGTTQWHNLHLFIDFFMFTRGS